MDQLNFEKIQFISNNRSLIQLIGALKIEKMIHIFFIFHKPLDIEYECKSKSLKRPKYLILENIVPIFSNYVYNCRKISFKTHLQNFEKKIETEKHQVFDIKKNKFIKRKQFILQEIPNQKKMY